jgi:hypothetical protein
MDFGSALVRMHRTEVCQPVPVVVLDEQPLNLRQTPLILGENSLSIRPAHPADLTHDTATARSGRARRHI